jgi:hypothetical protein
LGYRDGHLSSIRVAMRTRMSTSARGGEEEIGCLIDAIVESEYISSCYVSSGETPVSSAYVIADKGACRATITRDGFLYCVLSIAKQSGHSLLSACRSGVTAYTFRLLDRQVALTPLSISSCLTTCSIRKVPPRSNLVENIVPKWCEVKYIQGPN